MRADDRALVDLASSVADGQPVDWQHVEAKSGAAERRIVRHLRLVENIASLYRSIPFEDAEPVRSSPTEMAPPVAEPAGPRWGRLVMLDQIGRGASSEVFQAWDTELHRTVALKLLHDTGDLCASEQRDHHARVMQEARRLARVRHSNVVHVYGAEEHDGRVGLWMELVRGESLELIVATRGTLSASEASTIGQDLCAALAAVHGSGVLHRDVKAQNVLRESGGRTVLMDFGTGEELQENSGSARMAGTPLYVAPEVFRGQAATIQSDLYSLGVLLFYLVSGKYPVSAASIEQLARAHGQGDRRRLRDVRPDLPAAFVQAVERALDPDPAQRYRTAGEMEVALREGPARFQPAPVTTVPWWRALVRTPELATLYVAGLALVVALGAIVWSRTGSSSPPPATTAIRSIAVLPLADVSGPSPSPYFAEGLTDQLIATLGQIKAIRVASRTSVMQFKDSRTPIQDIFGALRVDALVEGTVALVQTAEGPARVRVNARLVRAGSDTPIFFQTLERSVGDTLVLEADLARQIANAIHATISESESRRLTQARSTDPAAEEAYFQGRYRLGQYGIDHARRALEAFNRAVAIDPQHAAAWAGAARCHISLGFDGVMSQPAARASALAEINKALTFNEELPEAHAVLADLKFYYDWDWAGAEREYQRAIELNPSLTYARSQYARYLAAARRLDEAVAESARARGLDPLSAEAAQTDGLIHYYRRDFTGAIEALERSLDIDPGFARARYVLGRVHEASGRIDQARQETEKAFDLAREPGVSWRLQQIRLQAIAGETDEARKRLDELTRDLERRKLRINVEDLAYFYSAVGERERALAYLERAVDERDPAILWIAVDPRVDNLRENARFAAMLRRIGLPQP